MKSALSILILSGIFLSFPASGQSKKRAPVATSPALVIDYVKTLPDADRWVKSGDEINIEMKGTPAKKAYFLDDQPMKEIQPGIYRGRYVVRNDDLFTDEAIEAYIKGANAEFASAETAVKIKYLAQDTSAVTNNQRSYLSYGLGDDRLGGAKMGSIDSNIRLRITGKTGDMYHVRLSPERDAWIGEEYIRFDGQDNPSEPAVTGSWMIKEEGHYDVLRLSLPYRLPYVSYTEAGPATVTLDVFGANSNTNWITQRGAMKSIADSWYEQPSENVFRLRIRLQNNQLWGYETAYEGNVLVVKIKHRPEDLRLSGLSFMLDAGHGGTNTGAKGAQGTLEKNITLQIVQKLGKQLEKAGAKVSYTRIGDVTLDMQQRLSLAEKTHPDILISIHCNSSGNASVQGTSTYYKHVAYRSLSRHIQEENTKLGLKDFGNIGSFNFTLNSATAFPNVLVETAFISNPEEEKKLVDENFQNDMAKSITKGVKAFLKAAREGKLISYQ